MGMRVWVHPHVQMAAYFTKSILAINDMSSICMHDDVSSHLIVPTMGARAHFAEIAAVVVLVIPLISLVDET